MSRFGGWTPEAIVQHRRLQALQDRYRDQRWPLPVVAEVNARDKPIQAGFDLRLPYPPTANTYVRHPTGHHYMTVAGRQFLREVLVAVKRAKVKKLLGRLEVIVRLCPKNRQRHDIDNRLKPLLDALEQAGCFDNDEQIDRIEVSREWDSKAGDCFVTVRALA